MVTPALPTRFAPAERASPELIRRDAANIASIPLIRQLFDAVPDFVMILNAQRQVVFANRALMEMVHPVDEDTALGMRPGEFFGCIHSGEEAGGCGTSEYCQTCGTAQAILIGLSGKQAAQDCRIGLRGGEALDMRVYASPIRLAGGVYTLFVMKDISHEKRRRVLERLFFHDILNSVGALRGLTEVLGRAPLEEKDEIAQDVWQVCDRLIDEIKSQKQLVAAENNELRIERSLLHSRPFLEEIVRHYSSHELARLRKISFDRDSCDVQLVNDPILLRRVLGNMIKNGLEACRVGETISVGCRLVDSEIEFWVNNPGVISDEVRLQIFQRSFSTKGPGRGLGTYSIRLLGERYLMGKVAFTSTPEHGTTFMIRLPAQ